MFQLYYNDITSSAAFLYTFILFFAMLLAGQVKIGCTDAKSKFFFYATFLFLWFFYALNNIGTDLEPYREHFRDLQNFSDCGDYADVEIGHQILMVLLHYLTNSDVYGIMLYKTLQLCLMCIVSYKLRNICQFWIVILVYVALVYFQSFNVIRMCFAFTIGALSLCFFIEERYILCILMSLVTYSFHRSSIFFLAGVCALLCIKLFGKRISEKKLFLIMLAICIALSSGLTIFIQNVIDSGVIGTRYEAYYEVNDQVSIGIGVVLNLVPMFFLLTTSYPQCRDNKGIHYNMWMLAMVFTIIATAVNLLGYKMPIMTRANIYGLYVYLFYLSYYIVNYNNHDIVYVKYVPKQVFCILVVTYMFARFILQNNNLFTDAGIEQFEFIF